MFREYYSRDFSPNETFPMIERREFGFASFEGWMLRHRSFMSKEGLTSFLCTFVPRDAYFSCAYYENPEAEMEKKGWLGADMIFDIDADHIPTPCSKTHDEWACASCGFTGKGVTPEKCPVCNSEKFEVNTWPCEVCLNCAREETVKLLDFLMQDFGFSEKELRVFFSGHRGYHVHVANEAVKILDSVARKEIVDYILGLGFDPIFHYENRKNILPNNLRLDNISWNGRITRGIHDFILNAKKEDLANAGLKSNVIEFITKNKDAILKKWDASETLSFIKGLGPKSVKRIAEFCAKKQSAKIDTVVTTDIHRLIRLSETLHGKTGMKKVNIPISSIEDFDPFSSAIAFKKGTAAVFVSVAPEIRLGQEVFGPYKNQKVELPMAVAVLLICKGRAEVIE
jgi:DNA primase small subunit